MLAGDILNSNINTNTSSYTGQSVGMTNYEAENEVWRRIILNTPWIWKSKGSRKAIEFFFKFLGIPNGLIRFNEHVYLADGKLNMDDFLRVLEVIKVDILMIKNKPVDSIGHNALASLIYFGTFWAFLLQSITGFGLYAKMSQSFFPQLFAWTIPLMGGDLMARQIHHFLMWFFILFAIVHIYLVFYHDYIEQRGETSSIIGGWKFIEEDIADKEEVTETAETITKIAKKG
jgi:cytochrome b subunit of formate dehydrogenase